MRIWLANHYALPPNIPGIRRAYELANEWATEEDAEVTLWLSKFIHPTREYITQEQINSIEKVKGLKFKWLWSFPHKKNDIKRMVNMASFSILFFLTGLFERRPDVIVASSPHLFTGFVGWMLSKVKRCPVVFEVRDLWPDSLTKMGGLNNKLIVSILTWMESFLYRNATKVVVLTEYQRKFVAAKGIPMEKIELIPNGIVVSSWKPTPSNRSVYREKMGVSENDYVAIYTGAHGEANALEYVVQAAKHVKPDVKIVLIGDGPEKDGLLRIKEAEGLENVIFIDPVSKAEIFDYVYAADCGIISLTDNEIFRGARPNKLFDYSFIGLPIITSVDGEIRDIVEENQLGIFSTPEDSTSLAEAIDHVRAYPQERLQQIKESGYQYVDREGNREKLAHVYYELLEKITN